MTDINHMISNDIKPEYVQGIFSNDINQQLDATIQFRYYIFIYILKFFLIKENYYQLKKIHLFLKL